MSRGVTGMSAIEHRVLRAPEGLVLDEVRHEVRLGGCFAGLHTTRNLP